MIKAGKIKASELQDCLDYKLGSKDKYSASKQKAGQSGSEASNSPAKSGY
jgi:hypothetical protein